LRSAQYAARTGLSWEGSIVRLVLAWVGAFLIALALPASADAQGRRAPLAKEPPGYREAIDTALQEVELGNYEEAREQFARAHALFPNARTLRGLGISEFELRRYVTAVGYLEQALASPIKPMEGGMRRDTEALLLRAKSYVGKLSLSLSPELASVIVDGATTIVNAGEPVLLDVGDHVLEFRAEGYATERREVSVRGGQGQELTVTLAALVPQAVPAAEPTQAPPAAPLEAPRSERTPVYKRWWLWTVVGVVVAGAAVGTALALTMKTETKEYRALPTENTPAGAGLQPWRF
jgi:hypothetical protein